MGSPAIVKYFGLQVVAWEFSKTDPGVSVVVHVQQIVLGVVIVVIVGLIPKLDPSTVQLDVLSGGGGEGDVH